MELSNYVLVDEVLGNSADWDRVQQAIINKGVAVPQGTPTSQYADKIGEISGGGGGDSSEWRPNPQWVTMPPMPPEGEQKLMFIVAVSENNPYAAVRMTTTSGQYSVDWGDGVVTLHDSNTTAEYTYDISVLSSQVTDAGYKTAVVTVASVIPNSLATALFYFAHSADARTTSGKTSTLLYIRGRAKGMTSILFGTTASGASYTRNLLLEWCDIVDTESINATSYMFAYCSSLRGFNQLNISHNGSYASMFINSAIRIIPSGLDMSMALNLTALFNGCSQLRAILSTIDLRGKTNANITNIFGSCYALEDINILMDETITDISLQSIGLNRANIIKFFKSLHNRNALSSGTITLSYALGMPRVTAEDRLIATSKNWTIVG